LYDVENEYDTVNERIQYQLMTWFVYGNTSNFKDVHLHTLENKVEW